MSQPEFARIEFFFMPFSQAFEDRHFTKREISSACLERQVGQSPAQPSYSQPITCAQRYAAIRQTRGLSIVNPTAMLETRGPVNCLSVEVRTRSKRNFHRPESNCRVAINCACEAFMVDQQTSQMLAPARVLELVRDPRVIAAAVTNATTAPIIGLSAANQKFVFMLISQAFKDRHFANLRFMRPALRRIVD